MEFDTGAVQLTTDGELLPLREWKTPYNHNTELEALRTSTACLDESKAQQHGKEEADINVIVNRFLKTGTMPQIPLPPSYANYEGEFNFQDAMNIIAAGKQSFMGMDAEVRDAFRNDPARFVETIDRWLAEEDPQQKEQNLEIMRAMNLAVKKGPIADQTTLGDVLAAIKEQGTPREPPAT